MNILKNSIDKKKQVLVPIDMPKNEILSKLEKYETDLKDRLNSVQISKFFNNTESSYWNDLLKRTTKLKTKNDKNTERRDIQYMEKIATAKCRHYSDQKGKLDETESELLQFHRKVKDAVLSLKLNHDMESLMGEVQIQVESQLGFDITHEERDIRQLLHSTDAFLEITQLHA